MAAREVVTEERKQAALVEGVYTRRLAGVTAGAPSTNLEAIAARVDRLLSLAAEPC